MSDFTLSITKHSSCLTVTATGRKQVTLELPGLSGLAGAEAGRRLYQQIFSGPVLAEYQAGKPERVLVYGPGEVLDWPWQRLHDGVSPLVLRHPLLLLPSEREQALGDGIEVEDGPLRVLLTLTSDEEHAALGAAIDQWIDRLEQRYAGRVVVRKVKVTGGYQGLLKVFRQALAPFHLWQHVGPCGPGLALQLGKDVVQARDLNTLLAQQQEAVCCIVLATYGEAPPASALSQLRVPFVLCQVARPGIERDHELLRGFYERLLTHDLAVAGMLGQREAYREDSAREGWGNVSMVAQTTQLLLGVPRPVPKPRPGDRVVTRATMLVLKANPPGALPKQVGLRIEQEINQIKAVLRENRDVVDLQEEGAVRRRDLSRHLQRHQPVLLHFSGHGTEEGELVLEKYVSLEELQAGTHISTGSAMDADYIEYADIARILSDYRATLRCVVLNACSTELLAEAICAKIPCAIGMRGPINDFLAVRFAEIFYRSLTMGESVGLAFRKARNDILSNPNARTETFQLKSRTGVNPDEIYIVPGRGDQS